MFSYYRNNVARKEYDFAACVSVVKMTKSYGLSDFGFGKLMELGGRLLRGSFVRRWGCQK